MGIGVDWKDPFGTGVCSRKNPEDTRHPRSPIPISIPEAAAAFAIIALGAAVQGCVGFGFALISAPVLLILDPAFVPGPLLASGLVLTPLMARRERHAIDVSGLRYGLAGRCAGTAPAVWLLPRLSQTSFDLLFALMVLLAVALSLVGGAIRPSPGRVGVAAIFSGFMGTLSSIGGPPLALVYQGVPGPAIRSTLSVHYLFGASLSLVGVAWVGRFGATELALTGVLVPGIVVGFLASRWGMGRIDRGGVRPAVLALSSFAALAVLWKALA